MSALVQLRSPRRTVTCTVDGQSVSVPEGSSILDAAAALGKKLPTLCYLETLHPVNACRVCVVEVEGSRVLVPSCSRTVEAGMVIRTDTEREQLGTSTREPSTSTTHTRHAFTGWSVSR